MPFPSIAATLSITITPYRRRGEGGEEWLGGPLWSPALPVGAGVVEWMGGDACVALVPLPQTVILNEMKDLDLPGRLHCPPPLERNNILIETLTPHKKETNSVPGRSHLLSQALRFGLTGGLNTLVDLLILNALLGFFPTTSALMLLAYNSLAYSLGAINSFLLNKFWTFASRQKMTRGELARFTLITLCGIGWSSAILWLASSLLHPFLVNATVWANASKVVAITGTALISYLGMRLWVFVSKSPKPPSLFSAPMPLQDNVGPSYANKQITPATDRGRFIAPSTVTLSRIFVTLRSRSGSTTAQGREMLRGVDALITPTTVTPTSVQTISSTTISTPHIPHSLSVVLPAYNEEQVIGATLEHVLNVLHLLAAWLKDFEVIVVNDGSTDHTGAILSAIVETGQCVSVVTHEHNQGYGAALADGFAAATKELTFFMDSDGQFDFRDLARLLLFIDEYDAVIGYRLYRQDTWLRKLNAWGWNLLIRIVLGIHVRDIDCAFKLLRTAFLQQHPPKTRGAMINAELLYHLKRAGYTYREVGVHHLSRRGGRATGANLRVIARAFRELFSSARQWRSEESAHARQLLVSEHHPF
jgi:putative flippase GtrA